jgi:conjugal transfer/entry exclusion protein
MGAASGVTNSSCCRPHRQQEFLRFVNDIDANLPRGFDVRLVMDSDGTHKVTKVRRRWRATRAHVAYSRTAAEATQPLDP